MAREICLKPCVPPPGLSSLKLHLPFGTGFIQGSQDISLEVGCNGCDLTSQFLLQIQPLLAGFGPIFCVLGCVGAIVKFATSVKDAIASFPPRPDKLFTSLARIVTKCDCLVQFVLPPPIGVVCSFVLMVRDILAVVESILNCLVGLINTLLSLDLKVALLLGSRTPELQFSGQCLGAQLASLSSALAAKLGSVSTLPDAIAAVFDILSAIPGIPSSLSDSFDALTDGTASFSASLSRPLAPGDFLGTVNDLINVIDEVLTVVVDIASICPQ